VSTDVSDPQGVEPWNDKHYGSSVVLIPQVADVVKPRLEGMEVPVLFLTRTGLKKTLNPFYGWDFDVIL
jgi:hypothetical protein